MAIFLPLPIPVASLILGIKYSRKGFSAKKNIIVGAVFAALLVLFGSFTFIFGGMYSRDFAYVKRIEAEINFDLPDSGKISTQDWMVGTQTGPDLDSVQYYYSSDITFTYEDETAFFNKEISQSNLWLTSVKTTLMGLVPSMYSHWPTSARYDFFMIYNIDLKLYNTMPEVSGTYRYVFIAYNSLDGNMIIGEYSLAVLI